MKFAYFGSSNFSCTILRDIYKKFSPSLIITQPDKPKGRGLKLQPTAVSVFAQSKKIPLFKPLSLSPAAIKDKLDKKADIFIVADYGRILPAELLAFPRIIAVGIHPSLLPRYRGAAPVDWALINGEAKTGVTTFKINEAFDSGAIILQREIPIDYNDDIFSLTEKLAHLGAEVLIDTIKSIEKKNYVLVPQDESQVTFAPKLKKQDGRIDWKLSAEQIRNLIRATRGWPSAYTYYNKKLIKILEAEVLEEEFKSKPSIIVKIDRQAIYVATQKGILKIKKLKPEGKKEMDAWSFVCGWRLKENEQFA